MFEQFINLRPLDILTPSHCGFGPPRWFSIRPIQPVIEYYRSVVASWWWTVGIEVRICREAAIIVWGAWMIQQEIALLQIVANNHDVPFWGVHKHL